MIAGRSAGAALAMLALLGACDHARPLTRGEAATVERAVAACTDASVAVMPFLKRGERSGAQQAAVMARNACSRSRTDIVAAVGDRLPACRNATDLEERAQIAELRVLDGNGAPGDVASLLDRAIAANRECATGLTAEGA